MLNALKENSRIVFEEALLYSSRCLLIVNYLWSDGEITSKEKPGSNKTVEFLLHYIFEEFSDKRRDVNESAL